MNVTNLEIKKHISNKAQWNCFNTLFFLKKKKVNFSPQIFSVIIFFFFLFFFLNIQSWFVCNFSLFYLLITRVIYISYICLAYRWSAFKFWRICFRQSINSIWFSCKRSVFGNLKLTKKKPHSISVQLNQDKIVTSLFQFKN